MVRNASVRGGNRGLLLRNQHPARPSSLHDDAGVYVEECRNYTLTFPLDEDEVEVPLPAGKLPVNFAFNSQTFERGVRLSAPCGLAGATPRRTSPPLRTLGSAGHRRLRGVQQNIRAVQGASVGSDDATTTTPAPRRPVPVVISDSFAKARHSGCRRRR